MSVHSQPLSCCPAMIYVLGRRERECKLLMRGDSEGRLAIWIIPDVHDKKMKLVRQESFEKLPGKNDWSYLFMQIIFTVHNVVAERLCFHRRVCHSVHGAGGCVSQHALGQTPSPPDGHCSGRYASYWNAFLFGKIFAENCMKMKEIGRNGEGTWIRQWIMPLKTQICTTDRVITLLLLREATDNPSNT